ncbi:MAG: type II secretion system minor pseudopilin GspI [Pseudomonadota bacterium]|nr:type II secretion system minor pseudopilin GspI [Pseudomonadota bacterium]
MNTRSAVRGFTLLEVMVALAIFAVAAIALTQAGMAYTHAVSTLSDRSLAHYVLMNEAVTLRINQAWPEGQGERLVEEQGQRWQIRYQTYPTPTDAVRRVELSVYSLLADQPAETPSQRLVVFLHQPSAE